MSDRGLMLIHLKMSGNEVQATYVNKAEYLAHMNGEIQRMEKERELKQQEMANRIRALNLSRAEQTKLIADEIKALEEAHRRKLEAFIQEKTSEIDATKAAGQKVVNDIRAKTEQMREMQRNRMEELQAQYAAEMERLREEGREVDRRRAENMKTEEKNRARWEQEREAGRVEAKRRQQELDEEAARHLDASQRAEQARSAAMRASHEQEMDKIQADRDRKLREIEERKKAREAALAAARQESTSSDPHANPDQYSYEQPGGGYVQPEWNEWGTPAFQPGSSDGSVFPSFEGAQMPFQSSHSQTDARSMYGAVPPVNQLPPQGRHTSTTGSFDHYGGPQSTVSFPNPPDYNSYFSQQSAPSNLSFDDMLSKHLQSLNSSKS